MQKLSSHVVFDAGIFLCSHGEGSSNHSIARSRISCSVAANVNDLLFFAIDRFAIYTNLMDQTFTENYIQSLLQFFLPGFLSVTPHIPGTDISLVSHLHRVESSMARLSTNSSLPLPIHNLRISRNTKPLILQAMLLDLHRRVLVEILVMHAKIS